MLSVEEEAVIIAFRRHTLLPLDDCLYALQPTIPNLIRSSLQRHGIGRLSDVEGDRPAKKKLKTYPTGIMLPTLGLSHSVFGERLLPVGTLYDPFIERGLDALNYACYQDARFLLAATPAGVTLAPEGGAHQSIAMPLIGIAQDGPASFEPALVYKLAVMMRWAFEYMQRSGEKEPDKLTWLRDTTGCSVYLRLSARPIEHPKREMTAELERDIINGAYWMRRPGPNAQIVVAYTGVTAPEAIEAIGLMAEDRRDIGLLAVT